jgi:WD40 repeat protein
LLNLSEATSSSLPLYTLSKHCLDITQLSFSHHSSNPFLLSASLDQTLRLWLSSTLESVLNKSETEPISEILPCTGLTKGAILSTCVHPCDLYSISTTADGSFLIHDLTTSVPIIVRSAPVDSTSKTISRLIRQPLTHCAIHPDGMLFCTCTADGVVTFYDISTLKSIISFNILSKSLSSYTQVPSTSFSPLFPITSVCYSEDGRHLAISDSTTVNIIDLTTISKSNYRTIPSSDLFPPSTTADPSYSSSSPVLSVSYDWSGRYLAACGRKYISVVNTKNSNVFMSYPVSSNDSSLVYTNSLLTFDGKTVIGGLSDGTFVRFSSFNENNIEKKMLKETE